MKKLIEIIKKEKEKQEKSINLIASENYVSQEILNAQGSILTNKYAEGYPGKRYYSGCKFIDKIERNTIKLAKKLFKADYANVQPHSGSQANQAVYMALCNKNDIILGMKLDHGGHLTHGSEINYSGKMYNFIKYGLNKYEYIDYNEIEYLSKKFKPKLIVAGTSSYSKIIDWNILKKISEKVNAYLLVDISHIAGLIISNLYPSPINVADVVTSTTQKTIRGPRGGIILAKKNKEIEKKINSAVFPGIQGGPFIHTIAAKLIAFEEALLIKFKKYQKQTIINTKYFSEILKNKNFEIISGETDTHLFLVNLKNKKKTGEEVEKKLEKANILVNKNSIPNDYLPSKITSGIRIGTPAITTRGFKTEEIKIIAKWIDEIITKNENPENTKKKVINLCKKFPIYK